MGGVAFLVVILIIIAGHIIIEAAKKKVRSIGDNIRKAFK